jgi:hypothetical protein
MSSTPEEKYEITIWDEAGEHPTGPTISRYTQSGQIYVGGMKAEVTGLDEEQQRVILGWDVETGAGWEHREQRIRLDQYYHLLYGHTFPGESQIALLAARQAVQAHIPEALKALDDLYHKSFEEDKGASYEQARAELEAQVNPLGYTLSWAECGDAKAGAERFSYGAMRHVLVPLPV